MTLFQPFSTGGFVLHKALSEGRTSAWYDSAGTLLDAEYRNSAGKSRRVAPGSERWRELEALGRVYASRRED